MRPPDASRPRAVTPGAEQTSGLASRNRHEQATPSVHDLTGKVARLEAIAVLTDVRRLLADLENGASLDEVLWECGRPGAHAMRLAARDGRWVA